LRSMFWLTAPASIEPLSPEASTIIGGAGVGGGERLGDVIQALALGLDAKDGLRPASRRFILALVGTAALAADLRSGPRHS
jgi:hypothetical protein